jgi:acyl-CoA synthetase (AMP-forming)/AMP-acid ligase II/alkylation response protein AidB-like acyl-CoA dehydrogenase
MQPTIVEIAARRARDEGDQLAYAFLADGALEGQLTFSELDAAARAIAAGILADAHPGDRALLVYEAGLDFVCALLGCMYAGVIAVPLPAPEASRVQTSMVRLEAVMRDCGARLLLGNPRTLDLMRGSREYLDGFSAARWLDTQELAHGEAPDRISFPPIESLAYLQYTSGSTTSPKGVMISHENIVGHLAGMQMGLGYDASTVSICWMPHFHDYGLIEGVLLPLFNGTPAYLMSPFAFLKRPASWLDAISRFRGTHTQAFNFAYRYCARRVTDAQREALDLSSLRSAGNGGEPIHPDTSEEFFRAFSSRGLRREALAPVFGLAEATLLVSAVPVTEVPVVGRFNAKALGRGEVEPTSDERGAQSVVACGRLLPETEVAIVEPQTRQRRQAHEVGEIWVSAPGVARGYWERPNDSAETFHARIAGEAPGPTYMRTGDLGFMHDGQLYISAREKDLIIVHGLNHYPQDIEWTVQQTDAIMRGDNGAAFSIDVDGEERLCIVQEVERGRYAEEELAELMRKVSDAITEQHGIPLHGAALIKRASLPKTTSGKIKRRACRQAFLDGALDSVYLWPAARTAPGPKEQVTRHARDANVLPDSSRADALIAWMRTYAERHINSRLIDERRCLPPNVVLDFGNRGMFGLQAPEQYGGLALGTRDTLRVYIQLAAIDPTIATLVFLHNTNGVRPILQHATPAMRDELMPILARGRELAAFTLSEPGAGSNLGGVQATAKRDGDGWKIDGTKRWNGSAWCGVISVFARLVDAEGRARGLTGFVVRQTDAGVEVGPESLTMGIRGIIQNSITFNGVRVGNERMLGEPGEGMQVVEDVLSHGRLATASVGLGAALRSAQLIRRYASRRTIETGLLIDNPQARVKISEMVHRISTDRELLLYCAARLDEGDAIVPEVAMAIKVSATDTGNFAADLMVQLLGGRGYMENNIAPQLFRDARMLSIGEGANEGLIAAVGRSVRIGDSVQGFLGRYEPTGEIARRLNGASEALERRGTAGTFAGEAAVAWQDVLRGRLAVAALNLAAAMAIGEPATIEWGEQRFVALCTEAESNGAEAASVLPSDLTVQKIDAFRELIGDIEPLAPDVDYALDPLLRREAAVPAGNGEVPSDTLEQKKARLKKLLLGKNEK